MLDPTELVKDVGTLLEGEDAVREGLIDEVGGISQALNKLHEMIDERKNEAFQMAYHDGTYSYIIVGYGQQETSGYSISVNDVYQGEDGIWVDTDFIGPEKSEKTEAASTSPFVVIKIDAVDQTIRFKN